MQLDFNRSLNGIAKSSNIERLLFPNVRTRSAANAAHNSSFGSSAQIDTSHCNLLISSEYGVRTLLDLDESERGHEDHRIQRACRDSEYACWLYELWTARTEVGARGLTSKEQLWTCTCYFKHVLVIIVLLTVCHILASSGIAYDTALEAFESWIPDLQMNSCVR